MNELSLVRLKIQELRRKMQEMRQEILQLERKERSLEQEQLAKENRVFYCGNGNLDVYLGEE